MKTLFYVSPRGREIANKAFDDLYSICGHPSQLKRESDMKINYLTEPKKFRPFTISIQTEDDYKLMKECITCLHNERKLLNGFQDIEYYNKTKILLEDWFGMTL